MKIELHVSDAQFQELINENIKDLPKEKIHEIILEGIKNYINKDFIEKIFVEKQGWYGSQLHPTSYLKEIIKENIPKDCYTDLVSEITTNLRENYEEILRKAIIDLLISGMGNSYAMENAIRETFRRMESERANR